MTTETTQSIPTELESFIKGSQPVATEGAGDTPTPETDASAADTPPAETKETTPTVTDAGSEAPKDAPKEAEKPSAEAQQPPADWEKRYYDVQRYVGSLGKENAELKKALAQVTENQEILNKKMDGTWTDADEAAYAARQAQADQASRQHETVAARLEGALHASKEAAVTLYGEEPVNAFLGSPIFNDVLLGDPIIRQVLANSDAPIVKAIELAQQMAFEDKYGRKPSLMYANIEKEVIAREKEKLMKEIKQNFALKRELPTDIGSARISDVPQNAATGAKPLGGILGRR